MLPPPLTPIPDRRPPWRAWFRLLRWPGRWVPGLGHTCRLELEEQIRACNATLAQFGRASDEEFTALARGLGELNGSLAEIRRQNAEFQLVLEDRDADRPIASAHEVYKRSVDLVHSSIGIAATEQQQMQAIEQALLAACGAGAEFRRNQLLLRIITLSIRMEATRMEPEHRAIFLNVGDAIGDITSKITASTEAAFQRIDAVVAETAAERQHLHDIECDLHVRARASIDTIQRELAKLQSHLAPCAEQGRAIARLLAQTEPLMLRTLSSLQHQDIVRQQLEHVAGGFSDLGRHLQDSRGGATAVRLEPGYIHRAAGVQQAHLGSARREIEHAAREVVAGLQSLLAATTELVDGYAAMEAAGAAAFADFRIVVMFRDEISQLTSVADKSKETNGNISRLVGRIEEVVRVFAEEITEHELEVKVVALNAQVAAARVPSADALNRLAEETSRVTDSISTVTRALLRDLEEGLAQLRAIRASAGEFLSIVTAEKTELETGIVTVTRKLTGLSQRVQADVSRVREIFTTTHRGTEQLLQRLRLPALIAESFHPAGLLCERLLAVSESRTGHRALSAEAADQLESHRDRYTMQKENATHTSALAGPAAVVPASPPPAGNAPLGPAAGPDDGIELF